MSDPGWKKTERRVARYIGAERNVSSGGATPSNRSDSTHDRIWLEVKDGHSFPSGWKGVAKLFQSIEAKAEGSGKSVLLVLHADRQAGVEYYDAYLRADTTTMRPNGLGYSEDRVLVCVPLWVAKLLLAPDLTATSS